MARNETPNMVPLVGLSFIFFFPWGFFQDEANLKFLKGVYSLKLTYIAPARKPSQKEPSLPTIHYEVRTVGFREAITNHSLSTIVPPPAAGPVSPHLSEQGDGIHRHRHHQPQQGINTNAGPFRRPNVRPIRCTE